MTLIILGGVAILLGVAGMFSPSAIAFFKAKADKKPTTDKITEFDALTALKQIKAIVGDDCNCAVEKLTVAIAAKFVGVTIPDNTVTK